jgi:type 1 glutamine amidotransferase
MTREDEQPAAAAAAAAVGQISCVPVPHAAAEALMRRVPDDARLKVLLVSRPTDADRYTHGHPTAGTTPYVCKTLLDAGFEVELVNNADRIRRPDADQGLDYFDLVVFHGKLEWADDGAVAALKRFVETTGRGLVVVHIASASFAPNWPPTPSRDWLDLIGSAFVYGQSDHPTPNMIDVRVAEPDHPIMAGIPPTFRIAEDELYQNMRPGADGSGRPLAFGTTLGNDGNPVEEPVAFVLERGNGRVFHLYLGHFISTHRDWRFQQILTQGMEWAARRR